MRKDRLQNKVATSHLTFPAAALLSTLLWWSEGRYSHSLMLGWGICCLMTYLWVETNNAYSLLRVRSRMTPALYALLMGAMFFLHPLRDCSYVAGCMLASYYLLFGAYQKPQAIQPMFHAFLCIGIGSLFFPQILYFVPFYLWYSSLHLHALTWRTFWAAMTGILLPYWFMAGYYLYSGDFGPLLDHIAKLAVFQPLDRTNYSAWDLSRILSFSYVAFFSLIGIVHYVRTSFNDKIRTRMYLYVLMTQEILIAAFLLLQPVHSDMLFGLLVMNSVPFISHYFTLTHSRLSHIMFILFILGFITLTTINAWIHLSTY